MATENSEASCDADPNFAVICGFLERFGPMCGLNNIDFLDLQEMLENTQEVPQALIDLHIKLLRKARKSVSSERWERALIKLCHTSYCSKDGWELERFGYKKARIGSKLRILKQLLEMQFDYNQKFKNDINKMSAAELRSQPIGRDSSGRIYWYQCDESCRIKVYKDDPDDESWSLIAKDRDGLVNLITQLNNGDSTKSSSEPVSNEDSNSVEVVEKPILDTGQKENQNDPKSSVDLEIEESDNAQNQTLNAQDSINNESINELRDENLIEENFQDDGGLDLSIKSKSSVLDQPKKEFMGIKGKYIREESASVSVGKAVRSASKDALSYKRPLEEYEIEEPKCIKQSRLNRPTLLIKKTQQEQVEEESGEDEDVDEEDENLDEEEIEDEEDEIEEEEDEENDENDEVGEEIEEPVMLIRGQGNGHPNKSCPIIVSEEIEDTFYFYGAGNGYDCQTGNESTGKEDDKTKTEIKNDKINDEKKCPEPSTSSFFFGSKSFAIGASLSFGASPSKINDLNSTRVPEIVDKLLDNNDVNNPEHSNDVIKKCDDKNELINNDELNKEEISLSNENELNRVEPELEKERGEEDEIESLEQETKMISLQDDSTDGKIEQLERDARNISLDDSNLSEGKSNFEDGMKEIELKNDEIEGNGELKDKRKEIENEKNVKKQEFDCDVSDKLIGGEDKKEDDKSDSKLKNFIESKSILTCKDNEESLKGRNDENKVFNEVEEKEKSGKEIANNSGSDKSTLIDLSIKSTSLDEEDLSDKNEKSINLELRASSVKSDNLGEGDLSDKNKKSLNLPSRTLSVKSASLDEENLSNKNEKSTNLTLKTSSVKSDNLDEEDLSDKNEKSINLELRTSSVKSDNLGEGDLSGKNEKSMNLPSRTSFSNFDEEDLTDKYELSKNLPSKTSSIKSVSLNEEDLSCKNEKSMNLQSRTSSANLDEEDLGDKNELSKNLPTKTSSIKSVSLNEEDLSDKSEKSMNFPSTTSSGSLDEEDLSDKNEKSMNLPSRTSSASLDEENLIDKNEKLKNLPSKTSLVKSVSLDEEDLSDKNKKSKNLSSKTSSIKSINLDEEDFSDKNKKSPLKTNLASTTLEKEEISSDIGNTSNDNNQEIIINDVPLIQINKDNQKNDDIPKDDFKNENINEKTDVLCQSGINQTNSSLNIEGEKQENDEIIRKSPVDEESKETELINSEINLLSEEKDDKIINVKSNDTVTMVTVEDKGNIKINIDNLKEGETKLVEKADEIIEITDDLDKSGEIEPILTEKDKDMEKRKKEAPIAIINLDDPDSDEPELIDNSPNISKEIFNDDNEKDKTKLNVDKNEIDLDRDEINLDEDELNLDKDEISFDKDKINLDEDEINLDKDKNERNLDENKINLDEDKDNTNFDEDKDKTNFNEDEINFDKDKINVDKDETNLDEDVINLDKDKINLDKEEINLDKEERRVGKNEKILDKDEENFGKNEENLGKAEENLDKDEESLDKDEKNLNKKEKSVKKNEKNVKKNEKSFNKNEKSLNKNEKCLNRNKRGLNKNKKGLNKKEKSLNKDEINLDKDKNATKLDKDIINLDKNETSFDEDVINVDKNETNLDEDVINIDKNETNLDTDKGKQNLDEDIINLDKIETDLDKDETNLDKNKEKTNLNKDKEKTNLNKGKDKKNLDEDVINIEDEIKIIKIHKKINKNTVVKQRVEKDAAKNVKSPAQDEVKAKEDEESNKSLVKRKDIDSNVENGESSTQEPIQVRRSTRKKAGDAVILPELPKMKRRGRSHPNYNVKNATQKSVREENPVEIQSKRSRLTKNSSTPSPKIEIESRERRKNEKIDRKREKGDAKKGKDEISVEEDEVIVEKEEIMIENEKTKKNIVEKKKRKNRDEIETKDKTDKDEDTDDTNNDTSEDKPKTNGPFLSCVNIQKLQEPKQNTPSPLSIKSASSDDDNNVDDLPEMMVETIHDGDDAPEEVGDDDLDDLNDLNNANNSNDIILIEDDGQNDSDDCVEVTPTVKSTMTLSTFQLDVTDSPPRSTKEVVRKKRTREDVEKGGGTNNDDDEDVLSSKKRKLRGRRQVDKDLRRSVEEQKKKDTISSEEEEEEKSKQKEATESKKKPPVNKGGYKRKKTLLGLDIPESIEFLETAPGNVRQSRRIAQLKIREEAERRKIEELTMVDVEKKRKSSKKDEDKDYKVEKSKHKKSKSLNQDDEPILIQSDDDTDVRKKKKKRRKNVDPRKIFDESNPWRSSSDSSSNEEVAEEEEEEISDPGSPLFKSDHEFSPESDIEGGEEVQPLKRARTARKEDDCEEVDDCSCQKCGKKDHPEWILLCDGCENGWHCSCLRPALLVIPEGDWFCPPCQHVMLVKNLERKLIDFDKKLAKRQIVVRRRERLAYVGISLANVLPVKKSAQNKDLPPVVRKRPNKVEEENESESSDSESSNDEEESGSESESDSEDEPIYQLRQRRQAHSYRFQDYDELINSAIRDEMDAVKGAGNQGKGKDISTIVNANEDEKSEVTKPPEENPENNSAQKEPENENNKETENVLEKKSAEVEQKPAEEESDEEDEEPIKPTKKLIGRKKPRKLNSLDVSSEDDAYSDEDFKGSSSDEDEDDYEEDLGSDSSDYGGGGRKKGPVRRSTRARRSRYDRDFINDDSDDDEEEEEEKKRKKGGHRPWTETESEESDQSWGRRKRSKKNNVSSSSPKKRKPKKSKKRFDDSDEDERHVNKKKRKIKYGGLNDDEDDEMEIGRRTRGKKINYAAVLASDSDDDEPKKPSDKLESDDDFVAEDAEQDEEDDEALDEEEMKKMQELKKMQEIKNATPNLEPPKILIQSNVVVPQQGVLEKINETGNQDEEEDEINPIEAMNRNLEEMDEEEMEKLMEEEEYANKQLQLMALQLEKEKKRKEREAQKKVHEGDDEEEKIPPKIPQKRGRKPKNYNPNNDGVPKNPNEIIPPNLDINQLNNPNNSLSETDSPKKRRGRGKGKKTLEKEAAAAAAAAAASTTTPSGAPPGNVVVPTANEATSELQAAKLTVAAPPQPFAQTQPVPSVITRMLQGGRPPGNYGQMEGFYGEQPVAGEAGPPPGNAAMPQTPFIQGAPGNAPSPQYRPPPAPLLNPFHRSSPVPNQPQLRLRHPTPQPPPPPPGGIYHHPLEPPPSGGGSVVIPPTGTTPEEGESPVTVPPESEGSSKTVEQSQHPRQPPQATPPPPQLAPRFGTPPVMPPSSHIRMPYQPSVQHPTSYFYMPQNLAGEENLNYPYGEQFSETNSPQEAAKGYEEENSGEFGGLVSYFSSQREDDLDT